MSFDTSVRMILAHRSIAGTHSQLGAIEAACAAGVGLAG
jgi:hypothetical protein